MTPFEYANKDANVLNRYVFKDTDAFQHIMFLFLYKDAIIFYSSFFAKKSNKDIR